MSVVFIPVENLKKEEEEIVVYKPSLEESSEIIKKIRKLVNKKTVITPHARQRMRERGWSVDELYIFLRKAMYVAKVRYNAELADDPLNPFTYEVVGWRKGEKRIIKNGKITKIKTPVLSSVVVTIEKTPDGREHLKVNTVYKNIT